LGWFDRRVISTGVQRSGEISGELVAGGWLLDAGYWTVFCNLIFEIFIFCLLAFLRVLCALCGENALTTKFTKKAQRPQRFHL